MGSWHTLAFSVLLVAAPVSAQVDPGTAGAPPTGPGQVGPTTAEAVAAAGPIRARAHATLVGAAGLPFGTAGGVLLGLGASFGVDVELHQNHDVGLRGWVLPFVWDSAPRWGDQGEYGAALLYRFHDDIVIDHVAPWVEIGAGIGGTPGCLAGDLCGGVGPVLVAGGGLEWVLHDRVALVAGAELLAQTGLTNGVSLFLVPVLFLGGRAG